MIIMSKVPFKSLLPGGIMYSSCHEPACGLPVKCHAPHNLLSCSQLTIHLLSNLNAYSTGLSPKNVTGHYLAPANLIVMVLPYTRTVDLPVGAASQDKIILWLAHHLVQFKKW